MPTDSKDINALPSTAAESKQISILSTKKLKPHQRELLLNHGIGLVELDFITILPLDFHIDEIPENIIFTSKNSVKAILDHPSKRQLQQKNIFCVGEKTAAFLEKNGFSVSKTADYGADLASEILRNHSEEKFLFFCGKQRHEALPEALKEAGVNLKEVEVYDTQMNTKKMDRNFAGVLFFSPSGVRSFCDQNDLFNSVAFCIGTTTVEEAKNHTKNIVIATKPSIENVIVQAVKYFKQNK